MLLCIIAEKDSATPIQQCMSHCFYVNMHSNEFGRYSNALCIPESCKGQHQLRTVAIIFADETLILANVQRLISIRPWNSSFTVIIKNSLFITSDYLIKEKVIRISEKHQAQLKHRTFWFSLNSFGTHLFEIFFLTNILQIVWNRCNTDAMYLRHFSHTFIGVCSTTCKFSWSKLHDPSLPSSSQIFSFPVENFWNHLRTMWSLVKPVSPCSGDCFQSNQQSWGR